MVDGRPRLKFCVVTFLREALCCFDGRASVALEDSSAQQFLNQSSFTDSAVVLLEDFLNFEEVEHLVSQQSLFFDVEDAHIQADSPNGKDSVIAAIERRIAELTDLPAHDHEEKLFFNQWSPTRDGVPAQADCGYHHDKEGEVRRHVTVIIYLSDVEEGG